MKRVLFICLLAFTISSFTTINPKMVTIKGTIVDQNTHNPLDYATITIFDAKTKEIFSGDISDETGSFSLKVPTGKYDIKIEYLAYKNFLLENKDIQSDLDLATINMEPDKTVLQEVEVVAEKTTVEYQLDKKVFNVGKDLIAKGGSVNDILDNVPSVTVDAGGTVNLRGNSNVKILINGKPSVLTANSGLEQLPAETVEKVEVITNPSARYEASGTAGIINIILKKNKRSGFGGSLQLVTGFPANHRANINVNYKTQKINLFSNVGYRYANFHGAGEQYQTTEFNGITSILDQTSSQKRNDDHYNIYFGGDYYINDKNTLTTSYYYNKVVNTDKTDYSYTFSDQNHETDSIISRIENYREPQRFNQLEIDHVKTFNKKGQKWTTNVQYDFWNDDENENITQQLTFPALGEFSTINTRDIESSKDLLIQSDFQSPISENAKLEAGVRGEIRRITSDYTVHIDDVLQEAFDNLLHYDERIYGAYVQYANKKGKLNYLLGLRVEHSDIGISDQENQFNDLKQYTNFFPTAHFTYNFSQTFNTQLSYSRRINRPRFWQLNPFGGLSDFRNIFAGNPDLNPMYTNSFELGMLKRWNKVNLNPSVYYQRNQDFFQFITSYSPDGYFLMLPVNLDMENRLGVEISSTYSPAKWIRISAEVNYYTYEQSGQFEGTDYNTKDNAWSARINSRLRFPKGLSGQASFSYTGPNQSGQNYNKSQYWANLAVSKDFWNDKASITINAINIFDSRINREIVTGPGYNLESSRKRIGTRVAATFTYRFNRKKSERDRMPD